MAISINTLITDSMAIGPGGASGHAETIFTFTNNRTASLDISGALDDTIGLYDGTDKILNYEGSEKLSLYDLVSVDIGNTVTSIGYMAFSECSGLTSVMIPNSVTNIEGSAFDSCTNLTSVTIPTSVTTIGGGAFSYCSGLTNVTFLGKTMEQVPNIEDGYGNKFYPWGISDTSIINVA